MESGGELAWFRHEVWRSIARPRDFARSLAREHFGLAGVLVALLAGMALSVGVDLLVLASKQLSGGSFIGRLATDAFLLGVRLLVSAAAVAWVVIGALRVVGGRAVTLDQLFTALSFALAVLVFAPIPGVIVAVGATTETLAIGALVIVALVIRVVVGIALNMRAILPPALAVASFVLVLVLSGLVLSDQISRMRFLSYAVVPGLAHDLAAAPATGQRFEMLGFDLTLPPGWRNATTGSPGEAARFESPTATIVVARAAASPVDTADAYANNVARTERLGVERVWTERGVTRIDGFLAVDDRYGGVYAGRTIVWRQFTVLPRSQGLALVYRAVAPADPDAAFAEAASIAATWHIGQEAR